MHETEDLESKIEEICQDSDKAAAVLKVATQTIGLFIIYLLVKYYVLNVRGKSNNIKN